MNFAKDKILNFATGRIQKKLGIDSNKIPETELELAEDFAEFLSDEINSKLKEIDF